MFFLMKSHSSINFVIRGSNFATEDGVAKNFLSLCLNKGRLSGYSVALNAEKIIRMYDDAEFRDLVQKANLLIYDGVACKLWLRCWGAVITTGMKKTNLPIIALELANEQSVSVGIFTGLDHNKDILKNKLTMEYPASQFRFIDQGYLDLEEMDQKLQRYPVQFCFLGLGSPRQEEVAAHLSNKHRDTMFFCVGGAFDVKLGLKRRAPHFITHSNFEWLYRLIQEPKRAPRYTKIMRLFHVMYNFSVKVQY